MPNTQLVELRVHATPGAHVGECIQEAIALAVKEWCNVKLRHNAQDYHVLINDLVATVRSENTNKATEQHAGTEP